jgi:hypothetical protein
MQGLYLKFETIFKLYLDLVAQLVKQFPEASLPCWQEPATGSYPEPDEYSPCPNTPFLLSFLPSGRFHSGSLTKILLDSITLFIP